MNLNLKYIFLLILYCTALLLTYNIPKDNEYYYRADEGTYYRQAKALRDNGILHVAELTDDYLANRNNEQVSPHPLRLGHLSTAILALSIYDSISTLSYLSIFFFIALVLTIYFYTKKWFGDLQSFIVGILICFSPLLCGLSERALADIDYSYFQLISLFLAIDYLKQPTNKKFILFLTALTCGLFVKEAFILYWPLFFIILIYLGSKHENQTTQILKSIGSLLIPIVVYSLINISLLGFDRSIQFLTAFLKAFQTPDRYLVSYHSGPWYVYLIGFILLSPLTSILAILYCGFYLFFQKKELITTILILFLSYFIICFAFLQKEIRFGLSTEIICRMLAGMLIYKIYNEFITSNHTKKPILITTLIVLAIIDITNYYDYFIINKIYDPTSFNLLKVKHIIP